MIDALIKRVSVTYKCYEMYAEKTEYFIRKYGGPFNVFACPGEEDSLLLYTVLKGNWLRF
jgi:hypothetical protein